MNLSFAALLSTLILSSAIIFLQIFVIRKLRISTGLSATFFLIVSLIFVFRLCFPVEFFFTKTLPSKVILPSIDLFFNKILFHFGQLSFTTGMLAGVIWIVGSLVTLLRFIFLQYNIHNLKKLFLLNPSFIYKKIKVIEVNEKISPVVIGFLHPVILFPQINVSERQKYFILEHEILHISNFHIWVKYVYEILTIVYWWNPVLYMFRDLFNQIIEIKADESLVSNLSEAERIEYVETLLYVGSQISRKNNKVVLSGSASFSSNNHKNLLLRTNYIFSNQKVKSIKPILFIFTVLCFYLSSCIIFESYSIDPKVKESTISINKENSFLVKTIHDRYKVFSDNRFLFEISNEDKEIQFPKVKVFDSYEEGERYVKKNY